MTPPSGDGATGRPGPDAWSDPSGAPAAQPEDGARGGPPVDLGKPSWRPPDAPAGAGAPPPAGQQPGWGQPSGQQHPGWGPPEAPPAWGQPGGQQQPGWASPVPAGWGGPPASPRPGVVPLRPLSLGEILDGAVTVVRRYPRPTLGLSAAVALVTTLIGVGLVLLLPTRLDTLGTTGTFEVDDGQLGTLAAGGIAGAAVAALAGIVLSGVITAVVGKAVLGEPLSAREAWHDVRPVLWRLVGLALLTGLLVVAAPVAGVLLAVGAYAAAGPASLLVGVPLALAGFAGAVYLYVRLSLAGPALVLERTGVREALRRSGVLVRHSFWRVLGIGLLAALVAGIVGSVFQLPFQLFGGGGTSGIGTVAGTSTTALVLAQIGSGVAQTLTAPFTSGVRALLYVDRRMRAEGLDVALAAAAAARR